MSEYTNRKPPKSCRAVIKNVNYRKVKPTQQEDPEQPNLTNALLILIGGLALVVILATIFG